MYRYGELADLPMWRRKATAHVSTSIPKIKRSAAQKLAEKKAPNRERFGRTHLTVVLILYDAAFNKRKDKEAGLELATTLRRGIIEVSSMSGSTANKRSSGSTKCQTFQRRTLFVCGSNANGTPRPRRRKKASAGKEAGVDK